MVKVLSLYKIKTKMAVLKANADKQVLAVEVISRVTNKILDCYFLPFNLLQDAESINSYSALVRYAKANQIQPTAEPVCPCPPETSDTVAIGDSAEVGGDSFFPSDDDIPPALKSSTDYFNIDEAIAEFNGSDFCNCGRVLHENDLALMMCPICADAKYREDCDVPYPCEYEYVAPPGLRSFPINGMEVPSNLE